MNLTADACPLYTIASFLQLQQVGRALILAGFLWPSTSLRLQLPPTAIFTRPRPREKRCRVGQGAQGRPVVLGCTWTLAARSWCPGTRASAPPRSRPCAARQGGRVAGSAEQPVPRHRRFLVVSVTYRGGGTPGPCSSCRSAPPWRVARAQGPAPPSRLAPGGPARARALGSRDAVRGASKQSARSSFSFWTGKV